MRQVIMLFLLTALLALPAITASGETIAGKDVTYSGSVPMQAFLRTTPGPGGMTHIDVWEVRDGHVVTSYDVDMTKIMHMIVVSDDLTEFRHVHPTLQADGHLVIDLALPDKPGGYHIYMDGLPHGIGRQVFRFEVPSKTKSAAPHRVLHVAGKTIPVGPYTVTITPNAIPIGEIVDVSVRILKDGKPARDLHPYLGVMAHGVFVGVDDLTYMHAHGMSADMLDMSGASDCGDSMMMQMTPMPPDLNIGNEFEFQIIAPKAQNYDFWLQFVGGKAVYTAPFLVTTI
jgi:hypothetical protein